TLKAVLYRLLELRPTLEGLSPYVITRIAMQASEKYESNNDIQRLDEVVRIYEHALHAAATCQYWVPTLQSVLSAILGKRPEGPPAASAIRESIEQNAQATHFTSHGQILFHRFRQNGSMLDLDSAITFVGQGVEISQDQAHRAIFSNILSSFLMSRYNETRSVQDIGSAVEVLERIMDPCNPKADLLTTFGYGLGLRFEHLGSLADLQRGVDVLKEALLLIAKEDDAQRIQSLKIFHFLLSVQAEQTGFLEDLDYAILIGTKALQMSSNEPSNPVRLSRLGLNLWNRYHQTSSIHDLNRSIDLQFEALNRAAPEDVRRLGLLSNVGGALSDRYKCSGSIEDLQRSIEMTNENLKLIPLNHPDRGPFLKNLSKDLFTRSEQFDSLEDRNQSAELCSEALKLTPPDHFDRASQLHLLGGILAARWQKTRSIEDLEHAIEIATQGVAATTIHSSYQLSQQKGHALISVYKLARDRSIEAGSHSIETLREIIQSLPLEYYGRPMWLASLGKALSTRFSKTGSLEDIDRAIQTMEEAIQSTPQGDPDRMRREGLKGAFLNDRYRATGLAENSDRAITIAYAVLTNTEANHSRKLQAFTEFASALSLRCQKTQSLLEVKPYLQILKEQWDFSNAQPSKRIFAAETVTYLLDLEEDWEGSSACLEEAVNLLPVASPRWVRHIYKQDMLKSYSGLASRAAAYGLRTKEDRNPYEVLSLLELGRGVIASFLMDLREDALQLEGVCPDLLAAEFVSLRDELDQPADTIAANQYDSSNVLADELKGKKRRDADQRFNEVIDEIRAQPGLSRFLLPPSEIDLKDAAKPGPIIIINVDDFRCDAILIETHQIRVLKLSSLTAEEVSMHVRQLHSAKDLLSMISLLEWLWEDIAEPCLHALGFDHPITGDEWPHVRWIPTGLISRLPLHAAGRHMERLGNTVLDRVISSYSLTVKSLIHGRKHGHSTRLKRDSRLENALLVAMPITPGDPPALQYAKEEIDEVQTLCGSLKLHPIRPQQQSREKVLDLMKTSEIFHFAGHGRTDMIEPSKSSLLLEDWERSPLTVGHLRDLRLYKNSPFLAYLSACFTSASEEEKLYDEGLNLVAACQLAGFRHVIGTLWEVADQQCVKVASILYQTLCEKGLTDTAVALGLHCALRTLRDESILKEGVETEKAASTPTVIDGVNRKGRDLTLTDDDDDSDGGMEHETNFLWVPYIHYGA
ncbi:MAG: hypothetical protein LQ340_005153, partial [Diploschistes diacapsis]